MKKIILLVVIIIIASLGFLQLKKTKTEQPQIAQNYKNATYSIENRFIKLENGLHEESIPGSSSKITTRYFGNEAKGDFDKDGDEDIAFILSQDGGGSGIFFYLVVALGEKDGSYKGTNSILLGDRISPQTTEFKDGKIIVNYADRKEGEPMTSIPSIGVSKYLKIENNILVEIK